MLLGRRCAGGHGPVLYACLCMGADALHAINISSDGKRILRHDMRETSCMQT